jgi:hypothetical protein
LGTKWPSDVVWVVRRKARKYRQENLHLIKRAEGDFGDLETHMEHFYKDKQLYDEAIQMKSDGSLLYKDTWWREHGESVERAEIRYGLLF